jgi:arylsulfatase A-like enzyme
MTRTGSGAIALLATLASVVGARTAAAEEARPPVERPNVVLILMDDLGYADIGSYGVRDARTPSLDRLAREGVRFTDAYANGPNCTPTRAALITGRYQQRVGLEWPLGSSEQDRGLAATGTSLPALLKNAGYATGLIGKWHLGFKPEFGPNAHGFGEFFGFLSGAVDFYTHRRGDGVHDLFENTTPVEAADYLTDEITRRAVQFIDAHASERFFLEIAYNAVHWPFEPPDQRPADPNAVPRPDEKDDLRLFQGPEDLPPATRSDYVRMLERADKGIGEVLGAIDRRGLSGKTLVVFTSDNGGEWLSHNGPLRHRKSTLWEGGIRVPLILRWPARLPAGVSSAQVAVTMDLTASIVAACGALAPTQRFDGIDILPSVAGGVPLRERELFWRIVRPDRTQKAVRSGRWKLLVDGKQLLLFDLLDDPGEQHEMAARHPDHVRRLKGLLADWEREVDQGSAARPVAPSAGAVPRPVVVLRRSAT